MQVPQIYTQSKNVANINYSYAVNALPITTTLVDVVVTTGTAGSYTISLDNIDDAPSYSSIILVVGNKEYDLMKSAYTFTTTKAQTFMWKVKLVQGVITQIIQTHGNGIDVTSINRQVYITGLQSEATIQVYDMLAVSVRKSQIYRVLKRKRYAKDYLPKKISKKITNRTTCAVIWHTPILSLSKYITIKKIQLCHK